jgi:hypothetical protein
MKKWAPILAITVITAGCAAIDTAVPQGYSGPVSIVKDSIRTRGSSQAEFFYLAEVDGRRIEDSLRRTMVRNQGLGFHMTPALVERNVPAKASTYRITGRTGYAAPILALTNPVYEVTGTVSFTPEPYKTYVVRGELGASYAAVWMEEEGTQKIVGEKIEVRGSSELGILQK